MKRHKRNSGAVSHPSRKNKDAARVGHPTSSHPLRKARGKDGAPSRLLEQRASGAEAHVAFTGAARGLKTPPPSESQLVKIAKPIYGGAFLAHAEGKAVFVPLTLPGEQARVRITESKRGYATAEAEGIVNPAPERIVPACPHFGSCGGCHYQHANYATQLAFKQAILRETLERGGVRAPDEIAVLAGEPESQSWGYRNRIRLAFDGAGNPGYRGRRSHAVIPISECPIAAPLLLAAAKAAADVFRQFAPAVRPTEISLFCDATETALLASIFTAGTEKVRFDELAKALREQITALKGVEFATETGKGEQPIVVAQWGAASLAYRAAGFDFRVDHGAFFQVNRFLVDALVERVTTGHRGNLAWDLFAGVGLFARSLTASFARVVAVESAPAATKALAENLKGTTGIAVRSTTLDFLHSRKGKRSDLSVPDLIVVDPPRTGLGPEISALLAEVGAPALVYVSCDPATLARDLRALIGSGYAIQSITLADLFPQTFHLETVVQLRRA
jgi:23S rRNA (uracil1939-C5)-methyltransferase